MINSFWRSIGLAVCVLGSVACSSAPVVPVAVQEAEQAQRSAHQAEQQARWSAAYRHWQRTLEAYQSIDDLAAQLAARAALARLALHLGDLEAAAQYQQDQAQALERLQTACWAGLSCLNSARMAAEQAQWMLAQAQLQWMQGEAYIALSQLNRLLESLEREDHQQASLLLAAWVLYVDILYQINSAQAREAWLVYQQAVVQWQPVLSPALAAQHERRVARFAALSISDEQRAQQQLLVLAEASRSAGDFANLAAVLTHLGDLWQVTQPELARDAWTRALLLRRAREQAWQIDRLQQRLNQLDAAWSYK